MVWYTLRKWIWSVPTLDGQYPLWMFLTPSLKHFFIKILQNFCRKWWIFSKYFSKTFCLTMIYRLWKQYNMPHNLTVTHILDYLVFSMPHMGVRIHVLSHLELEKVYCGCFWRIPLLPYSWYPLYSTLSSLVVHLGSLWYWINLYIGFPHILPHEQFYYHNQG